MVEAQLADEYVWGLAAGEQLMTLEALVGTLPLLEAVARGIEGYGPEVLSAPGGRAIFADWVGFALLRVPTEAANAHRARLQKALEKVDYKKPQFSFASTLDLSLNGAEALGRHFRPFGMQAQHVNDAPEAVRKHVLHEEIDPTFAPDARLVFLGGEALIDHYARNLRKMKDSERLRASISSLGRIRSDKALAFILELFATSKVKKAALAWLVEHAERTRPFLEKTAAGRGDPATWAKAALAKLPK